MGMITTSTAYSADPHAAGLVGYVLNGESARVPPERQGAMFDYVLASDGLYLNTERAELEVFYRIAPAEVRGLSPGRPAFNFWRLLVPGNLIEEVLRIATRYAEYSKETLFWLEHSELNPYDAGWLIRQPAQNRTTASCRPYEGQDEQYQRAIIEIHSHHSMPARFSATDNEDETGFRIYGVIGRLLEAPEIRLRVGVYGYFWEIPATWALELPEGLSDCNENAEASEE